MKVTAVPREHVNSVWPEVAPLLQKALDTTEDKAGINRLWGLIADGGMQLWVIYDADKKIHAAAVTNVFHYLTRSVLCIPFVGGSNMKMWAQDFLHTMERYAKDANCTSLQGFGRKGWERYLAGMGWTLGPPTFVKDI